ncbi:MAG: hypothetical protein ACJ8H8_11900 [Geminicoccaceae bacterium]
MNLDEIIECTLLLTISLLLATGTAIAGWPLRTAAGRQAARAALAVEEGDPWEGLITLLVVTSFAPVVILCSF